VSGLERKPDGATLVQRATADAVAEHMPGKRTPTDTEQLGPGPPHGAPAHQVAERDGLNAVITVVVHGPDGVVCRPNSPCVHPMRSRSSIRHLGEGRDRASRVSVAKGGSWCKGGVPESSACCPRDELCSGAWQVSAVVTRRGPVRS